MPTVKMYDPYRIIDPTDKGAVSVRVASRTSGGRFNGSAIEYGENSYPIESKYWSMGARWEYEELGRLMGDHYFGVPEQILPNETIDRFSWRAICEIVGAACKQATLTPSDIPAIVSAAHKFLAEKQYEIARAHLDALLGAEAPREMSAIDVSQTLSDWLHENFDLIPEVSY